MFMIYMDTQLGTSPYSWDITLIPEAAKKELLKIGVEPYLLFMHYVEQVHKKNCDLSLKHAAECLLFSLDQVEKAQALLVEKEWLKLDIAKSSRKNDPPIGLFILGFNSVQTFSKEGKPTREEFNFIGKYFSSEDDDEDEIESSEE